MISDEAINDEIASGMDPLLVRSEFYNEFTGVGGAAFYGDLMQDAWDEERIRSVPYDTGLPVHTAWDLGSNCYTAIWFFQVDYLGTVRVIDYHQQQRFEFAAGAQMLKTKGYRYGKHVAPHDVTQKAWGMGTVTRLEQAFEHGISFERLKKLPIADGIASVRQILPRCVFDSRKTREGLECLRQYSREDTGLFAPDGTKLYSNTPVKSIYSDGADAFRYLATIVSTGMVSNTLAGRLLNHRSDGLYDEDEDILHLPSSAIFKVDNL
jgi:hypothetical protein